MDTINIVGDLWRKITSTKSNSHKCLWKLSIKRLPTFTINNAISRLNLFTEASTDSDLTISSTNGQVNNQCTIKGTVILPNSST